MTITSAPVRNKPTRGIAADFIDVLQRRGQYTFTDDALAADSPQTPVARRAALRRMQERGRILRPLPRRDFFIVVPHEYHSMGAPPLSWYLDALMGYLGFPEYYVGLLTAAQWHGASHFAVQETQVVVSKQMRPMRIGREAIRLFTKATASTTPVEARQLPTGTVRVSTPEATAADLVRYRDSVGGLNAVATVLAELHKHMNPGALLSALKKESDLSVAQRLGYLLDQTGNARLTRPLARWLATQDLPIRLLDPGARSKKSNPLNKRWQLQINTAVEAAI